MNLKGFVYISKQFRQWSGCDTPAGRVAGFYSDCSLGPTAMWSHGQDTSVQLIVLVRFFHQACSLCAPRWLQDANRSLVSTDG